MQRRKDSLTGDFQVHSPVFTLEKVIRSNPRVVDETAREITLALKHLDRFDDAELVALAIREALSNALVHGNRCDPEKTITFDLPRPFRQHTWEHSRRSAERTW